MPAARPVVIVGAGIAGLTAALALARSGRQVVIVERAGELAEVGAGLQVSPNASRILIGLGLKEPLLARGVEPEALVVRSAVDGREIARIPLGERVRERHGAPYVVVHRGDLQAMLLAAVRAEPAITIHIGAVIEAVDQGEDAVTVAIRQDGEPRILEGDVLVGADGVHSSVRQRLMNGRPAVYSGRIAWRATIPMERWDGGLDAGRVTSLWLGRDAHLVHYPISAGAKINIIASVDGHWTAEDWSVRGDPAELSAAFARWPEPVRRLLALPDEWRKWALAGAPPDARWTDGRIVLIGDAVHGMLPFVAQGGAMAIEDAAVLARHLAGEGPVAGAGLVPATLAAFAAERAPRTERVAATARRNADVYHMGGLGAVARNTVMRALGPDRLLARMDWIWGWRG